MGFVNSPPTSANCPTKRRPVFESQVPSPWCARPRWRAARTSAGREPGRGDGARRAPWPPQAREEEVPLRKGQPPGEPEARPHPRGIECDTLGVRQGGGRSAGGRVSWSKPLSVPASGATRSGSHAGPGLWTGGSGHPLCSYSQRGAVNPGRPPASVPTPARGCGRGGGLRGAGATRPS